MSEKSVNQTGVLPEALDVPGDLYPYHRLILRCGCYETVTGPGCVDVFCCRVHRDTDAALHAARMDAFVYRLQGPKT